MKAIHLILGGARSGKSRYAQSLAEQAERGEQNTQSQIIYLATAQIWDEEMQARVTQHQADRPPHWQLVEAPVALAAAIHQHARADTLLLIDCLTLWLSNLLCDPVLSSAVNLATLQAELIAAVQDAPGQILLVSNEVGWGIVPDNALARHFRDEAGRLHQQLASLADRVTLVVAGLPLSLKN